MNLKNRINAINSKLSLSPRNEAKQKELRKRIEEARKRAGIQRRESLIYDVKPGASIAERLQAARIAHEAKNKEGNKRRIK